MTSEDQSFLQKSLYGLGELFSLYGKYARCSCENMQAAYASNSHVYSLDTSHDDTVDNFLLGASLCQVCYNNPYYNAAVVTLAASEEILAAYVTHEKMPSVVYSVLPALPGYIPHPSGIVLPCMGIDLSAQPLGLENYVSDHYRLCEPSLHTIATVNEAAYGITDNIMIRLFASINTKQVNDRLFTVGMEDINTGETVAVAAGLSSRSDVSDKDVYIMYVATLQSHRKQGLGTQTMIALMNKARKEHGAKTATLQASPMGAPIYLKLGFHTVGEVKIFSRSAPI